MNVTTISDLRKNAKKYLDKVADDRDVLVVSRGQGKSVVVLSIEDYNDLDATDYLNSSGTNRERLLKSIDQAQRGDVVRKSLAELKALEKK